MDMIILTVSNCNWIKGVHLLIAQNYLHLTLLQNKDISITKCINILLHLLSKVKGGFPWH